MIEVICGPMFCGKSEELIRRVRRATIARQTVQVFKPRIDNRYALHEVTSHNKASFAALSVADAHEVLECVKGKNTQVVAIDEAQFLGDYLPNCCEILANEGKRVIVAGLDMDFKAIPFGNMAQLMAQAEEVTKLSAICVVCGEPATRTHRLGESVERVVVGGAEQYEARCRKCHQTTKEQHNEG